MTFINAFTSSVLRRITEGSKLDTKTIAAEIGHKGDNMLRMWINGGNIPPLKRLAPLANAVGLTMEELLLPWLCDHDLDNFARYQVIGTQLMGPHKAADLLSGEDWNSETLRWAMPHTPMSAAEFVSQTADVPPGIYPDTEG